MEIPKLWKVQDFVARLPVGTTFGTGDAIQGTEYGHHSGVANVLNEMKCVEMVHQARVRVFGCSDRNVYAKLPDGQHCPGCLYERSGSSSCVIRHGDVRKIYESSL